MNAEIQAMIDEYNQVEGEQAARRRAIVESLRAVPGYHRFVMNGRNFIDINYRGHSSMFETQLRDCVQTISVAE